MTLAHREASAWEKASSVSYVTGPDGEKLTLDGLPAPNARRWVAKRKARVVAAVEGGLISRNEACKRYSLSDEEYESWRECLAQHGVRGLRVTARARPRG